jgi:hypothetical protein
MGLKESNKPPSRSEAQKPNCRKILAVVVLAIGIVIAMAGAFVWWWQVNESGYTRIIINLGQNVTLYLKGTAYNFSYYTTFVNGQFQERIRVTNGSGPYIDLTGLMSGNHYDNVLGLNIILDQTIPNAYVILLVKPI